MRRRTTGSRSTRTTPATGSPTRCRGSCCTCGRPGSTCSRCHLAAPPTDGLHRQRRCWRSTRSSGSTGETWTRSAPAGTARGDAGDPVRRLQRRAGQRRDPVPVLAHRPGRPHDVLPGRLAGRRRRAPGYTQDWRTNPIAAALNVHRKRIDYVFVGDPFLRVGSAGRVLSAPWPSTNRCTGIQASDHCRARASTSCGRSAPTPDGSGCRQAEPAVAVGRQGDASRAHP